MKLVQHKNFFRNSTFNAEHNAFCFFNLSCFFLFSACFACPAVVVYVCLCICLSCPFLAVRRLVIPVGVPGLVYLWALGSSPRGSGSSFSRSPAHRFAFPNLEWDDEFSHPGMSMLSVLYLYHYSVTFMSSVGASHWPIIGSLHWWHDRQISLAVYLACPLFACCDFHFPYPVCCMEMSWFFFF